ncbi:MAG: hypothetical protein R3A52_15930 [Polyangiales bacterium]
MGTRDTLRMFYERTGRKLYVGAGVSVFYPNEDSFAPDVIAVEEVEPHNCTRWVVSKEGRRRPRARGAHPRRPEGPGA